MTHCKHCGQETTAAAELSVSKMINADLLAALEETIAAAQIQLEGHGKGIKPSDRLSAAFNAGLAAIAKAKGQQ